MHDPEKSDSGIVVTKPTNKAGRPVGESVEPRPGTKGNADQQSTHRAQSRARVTQALGRVRRAARQRKKEKFTALLHHISVDTLRTAFYALKRKAAPGVDGMTWQDYEADLELRIEDLHGRVHRGAYRPQPSRRAYIDKADGKQRPLAIAALEDKIVQGGTVMVHRQPAADFVPAGNEVQNLGLMPDSVHTLAPRCREREPFTSSALAQ
jgi:RNA-directed DNA polymerase